MLEHLTIGQEIKQLRNLRKLKQEVLAKGICSVSYLSKVENDLIKPSEDILELILKRLDASTNQIDIEENTRMIYKWYRTLLENGLEEATSYYNEFRNNKFNGELQNLYWIIHMYYCIKIKDFTAIPKILNILISKEKFFSKELRYYFFKVVGTYYYNQNKFEKAFKNFHNAINIVDSFSFDDKEKADLFYSYAISATRIGNINIGIKYTELALIKFQSLYNLNRSVDCHVLLGICNKKYYNIPEAIKQYNMANEIANKYKYETIVPTILHNLGNLYSSLGDMNNSTKMYKKVLDSNISESTSYVKVQVTLSYIKDLFKMKKTDEALIWLKYGFDLLKKDKWFHDVFNVEYEFYNQLLNGSNHSVLDSYMQDTLIPMLSQQNKYESISSYCLIMADQFFNIGKYKKSSVYYLLSREFLKQSINSLNYGGSI